MKSGEEKRSERSEVGKTMTTILSWNTGKKKSEMMSRALCELVEEHAIDIVVLQECLGRHVNSLLEPQYEEVPYLGVGLDRRVRIFLKNGEFERFAINTAFENKLLFVHLRKKNGIEDFNIVGVHLYSKAGNTERQQTWKNLHFAETIKEFEISTSTHQRTVVVGDFNYNPYEIDLLDPNMFNAIENRHLISRFLEFPVGTPKKDYFYNPMWNLLGDYDYQRRQAKEASGTYFHYNEAGWPHWNHFDGMILRPSLMDRFDYERSEVIVQTRTLKFLKNFIIHRDESIIKEDLSDHLPIKFTLNVA
jgi:endonuclease/exonuclease/phosphatase family metal-dependent hydrolase